MNLLAVAVDQIDWKSAEFPYYLAIGGGIIAVLAIILYFIPVSRLKIPAVVGGVLGGLVVGVGGGMTAMSFMGYHWEPESKRINESPPEARIGAGMGGGVAPAGGMRGGPAGGMMGGGMMGGRGGGAGGGGGAANKAQLASLVTKLDQLTGHELTLELTDEQKAKVRDQLKGLADASKLSDEEAKKKLDAILDILKDNTKTLESAGYRAGGGAGNGRRGGGGGQPADPDVNPFKEGDNSKHLKSLQGRLGKESKV